MILKVTFCYILLTLCSISLAADVMLNVKGVTSIGKTDENFVCATLDWWPPNKCDYDQCPWGNTGILNLDLGNTIFTNAIKAFKPLRIRLGGSLQDQITYEFGKIKKCPSIKKQEDGFLFGFSKGCLPKDRWDEVNEFFNKTGVKLTFGLNALSGKHNTEEDRKLWLGDWNPKNAMNLMKYTISKGYKIDSYELGNELCSEGIGARIDSVQYAKDITQLRNLVNELYPDPSTRPKVLGPAGFFSKDWFDSFLQNVKPGVVDGVTHHIYNLGPGNDPGLIYKIQDPYHLSAVAQTFKDISEAVKDFSPSAGTWVGEAGGAYNSGGKEVSHTFVDGYWYLDQLGMTSTLSHKVYCRQTLVGGNYGLLNTTTFIPNPDYYGALLWHRLMGSNVLSVSHEGSPYLRTYAHCSKRGPGITVLLINMSNSTFNVSLGSDMNMYSPMENSEGQQQQMREEYHLTPKDGNVQSDVVLLNGTPLKLTETLDIPDMKPQLVDSSTPINVGSHSIVFVHHKSFKAPACQ